VTSESTDREPHVVKNIGEKSRWFVAEILVVVVGVLIALGIDEWRDEIDSREFELEYVRQIVDELRITEERIAACSSFASRSNGAAKQLKAAFDSAEPIQMGSLRRLLEWTRGYCTPEPILGSAMALVSTGSLRSFSNKCVNSSINNYLTDFRENDLNTLAIAAVEHSDLWRQLTFEAGAYGIFPEDSGIASDESPIASLEPELKGFLANSRAYMTVYAIVQRKDFIARLSARNADRTVQLREYLETYLATGSAEC